MKTPKLVDAEYMNQQHPETFEVPDKETLNSLKVGDAVKVCAEPERFWVEITDIGESAIVGRVDNHLFFTHEHGLKLGDEIEFKRKNIYSKF